MLFLSGKGFNIPLVLSKYSVFVQCLLYLCFGEDLKAKAPPVKPRKLGDYFPKEKKTVVMEDEDH